jgi:hydrogenase maturation protease
MRRASSSGRSGGTDVTAPMRTLVLGLGNDLVGDDAVGLLVARAVRDGIVDSVDVEESSASGMALLEVFAGYDRALVVDSVRTGRDPPGTVTELALMDVGRVVAPSLHHAGLPEMAAVAERLGLRFPKETRVLAVEVEDPYTLGAGLSESVADAVEEAAAMVLDQIGRWVEEDATCTTTTP